jgi:hypothetical protein
MGRRFLGFEFLFPPEFSAIPGFEEKKRADTEPSLTDLHRSTQLSVSTQGKLSLNFGNARDEMRLFLLWAKMGVYCNGSDGRVRSVQKFLQCSDFPVVVRALLQVQPGNFSRFFSHGFSRRVAAVISSKTSMRLHAL